MNRASILHIEADDVLDLYGFRHIRMGLTERVRGHSIGASVYIAEAGHPTGPFHYHYGVEEWVYVVSGEPTLRDHGGERLLQPGDVVAFPAGPAGVHTFHGPGTFVVFSTGTHREPWMSVYPDSGKVSGPEGILLASSRSEYWRGEGSWEPSQDSELDQPRSRELVPSQQIVNLNSLEPQIPADYHPPAGYESREVMLGGLLGAHMLGATLYELDPGIATAPYHYERGREEWVLVLSGTPTLRHPAGEDMLAGGDVVCFPDGPAGAHQLINRGSETVRLIIISTKEMHSTVHYPDSGKTLVRAGDAQRLVFRDADAVGYWDGEPAPR